MSVFSSPFSNYADYKQGFETYTSIQGNNSIHVTRLTHDMSAHSAKINEEVIIPTTGFSHFLIDSIIFDPKTINYDMLDNCYVLITTQGLRWTNEITFEKEFCKLSMNLIRMLQPKESTMIDNKSRIIFNKDLFLFEETCHGYPLPTECTSSRVVIKITNENNNEINQSFEFIIRKISRKLCNRFNVGTSGHFYHPAQQLMKKIRTEDINNAPANTETSTFIIYAIRNLSGYFLYTQCSLKCIKYQFSTDAQWNNNIVPQDNLIKHWYLSKRHMKALYETLEEILPHEIIYMIEKFCNEEYLYWFPFNTYKEWNEVDTIVGTGNLNVECNFISCCNKNIKVHLYRRRDSDKKWQGQQIPN
jgi:hypothetical protein